MIRTRLIALALVIFAASPTFARPAKPGGTRPLLQNYYHEMDLGWAEHDLTKAFLYYSDDFEMTGSNGEVMDFGTRKAGISTLLDTARLIKSTTKITSVASQTGGFSATVQGYLFVNGVGAKTGQMVKIEVWTQSRDFWSKTPSGWRLMRSRLLSARAKFNGRPMTTDDIPDPDMPDDDVPTTPAPDAPAANGD